MRHPLKAVTGRCRLVGNVALAVTALAIRVKMHVHAKTQAAPHGMMSFAGAGDPAAARGIVASWDREVRAKADRNLRLDPLFSLAWTNAIALADLWAGRWLRTAGWPGAGVGVHLAWGQWLAAVLAAAKDAALLAMLRWHARSPLPVLARWWTVTEIGLKTAGLVYAAAGALAWLAGRHRNVHQDGVLPEERLDDGTQPART